MQKKEPKDRTLKELGIPEFLESYLTVRKHVYSLATPRDMLAFNGMLSRIKENFVATYPHASLDIKEPVMERTAPIKREAAKNAKVPSYLWAYAEIGKRAIKLEVPNNEAALMRLCKLIYENHASNP